jgi:hypothetical protein
MELLESIWSVVVVELVVVELVVVELVVVELVDLTSLFIHN